LSVKKQNINPLIILLEVGRRRIFLMKEQHQKECDMSNRSITMSTYQTIIFHLKSGLSAREISKLRIAGRHKLSAVYQVAKKRGWLESSAIIPRETELKVFFDKQKKGFTSHSAHGT